MKVLVVKTSSLGDIIHTFPALSDAKIYIPNLEVDWVVEESFAEVPLWHPTVRSVIPISLRGARKNPLRWLFSGECRQMCRALRRSYYDVIIDCQGLLKSAVLVRLARGAVKAGYSWYSARESLASIFYSKRVEVSWEENAVSRIRQLFAKTFEYPVPEVFPIFGLDIAKDRSTLDPSPYCVFLHGTTWANKHWPEMYWKMLAKEVIKRGYQVRLVWGNANEKARAHRIAYGLDAVSVSPKMTLTEVAHLIQQAQGVVSVDTGLGHLAGALGVPTVWLYGPTDIALSSLAGPYQVALQANFPCSPCLQRVCTYPKKTEVNPPCFQSLSPDIVFKTLYKQMEKQLREESQYQ